MEGRVFVLTFAMAIERMSTDFRGRTRERQKDVGSTLATSSARSEFPDALQAFGDFYASHSSSPDVPYEFLRCMNASEAAGRTALSPTHTIHTSSDWRTLRQTRPSHTHHTVWTSEEEPYPSQRSPLHHQQPTRTFQRALPPPLKH